MSIPFSGKKIIVFAPHPDDEVLAAGGYIFTALQNKSQIKVVIVTNGENFGYALGKTLGNFLPITQKCQEFAFLRQQEAQQILKKLGLKKKDIIFLGFPDKSLKYLYRKNFSREAPYFSPLLKTNYSPFTGIYQRRIIFAGEELLNVLVKIIKSFCPDIIIMPSPYDDHSDHRTLAKFIKKSLEGIKEKLPQIYYFLIHKKRFFYPLPYGLHPDKELNPPLVLGKKRILWEKFTLKKEAILAKEKAILSYKTQMITMPHRLLSFLRKNELFHR